MSSFFSPSSFILSYLGEFHDYTFMILLQHSCGHIGHFWTLRTLADTSVSEVSHDFCRNLSQKDTWDTLDTCTRACRCAHVQARSMNLSRFVQSKNTPKRFLEPEVVTNYDMRPKQTPPWRLGLGRLSGKCYNGQPTGMTHCPLIPIAVGNKKPAFSRRSVKTGGNRNVSLISNNPT